MILGAANPVTSLRNPRKVAQRRRFCASASSEFKLRRAVSLMCIYLERGGIYSTNESFQPNCSNHGPLLSKWTSHHPTSTRPYHISPPVRFTSSWLVRPVCNLGARSSSLARDDSRRRPLEEAWDLGHGSGMGREPERATIVCLAGGEHGAVICLAAGRPATKLARRRRGWRVLDVGRAPGEGGALRDCVVSI